LCGAAVGIGLALSLSGHAAYAAAYGPGQQMPVTTIAQFAANPMQVLTEFPDGGVRLANRLRDLVASDPATLATVLSLLPNANLDQKAAMGTALAQATRLYGRTGIETDRQFALQIQQAVANTQDSDLIVAFAAAAGDRPIGAGGLGVSGGGAGGANTPLPGALFSTGGPQPLGGPGLDTGQYAGLTGSAVSGPGAGTGSSTVNNSSTSNSP
jgi:hypothetical protein